jgi:integrase
MPVYPGRRPKTFRVTVFANDRQHEWIIEGTRREARLFEARQRVELRVRPSPAGSRVAPAFCTFCVQHYEPHARGHLGADTWGKVRRYQVATLSRLLGRYRVDALRAEHVDAYKRTRLAETHRGKPITAPAVNNELRVLKTMLRWGREEAKLPIPELRFKMLPTSGKRRVHTWTLDEIRRLFAAAAELYPVMVPVLVFMLNTGCRKGEVRHAEWSWVDFDGRMLRIPVTDVWHPKDKEAREVPLSDSALTMLRTLERRDGRYIFVGRAGRFYETFPEEPFRNITAKAKLTGGPHTTRHTFASHFLRQRPDLPLLAQVLGHSTTRVTELYAHLLPGHLDRARNAVDMAPPSKVWRPSLATVKEPTNFPKKAAKRH